MYWIENMNILLDTSILFFWSSSAKASNVFFHPGVQSFLLRLFSAKDDAHLREREKIFSLCTSKRLFLKGADNTLAFEAWCCVDSDSDFCNNWQLIVWLFVWFLTILWLLCLLWFLQLLISDCLIVWESLCVALPCLLLLPRPVFGEHKPSLWER